MKRSSIVAIICWSIVAVILICIMVWGLAFDFTGSIFAGNVFPGVISCNTGGFYAPNFDTDDYNSNYNSSNEYEIDASSILSIDVSWVSGSVEITPYNGSTIKLSEQSNAPISEEYALKYAVIGSELRVSFCKRGLNTVNLSGKQLVVFIPQTLADKLDNLSVNSASSDISIKSLACDELDVQTASGTITLSQLACAECDIDTVSGDVGIESCAFASCEVNSTSGKLNAVNCAIASIHADSVSGKIDISGDFDIINISAISAAATISDGSCPSKFSVDTVSGHATLRIPEDSDFTVDFDKVSGDFNCEFPIVTENNKYICGAGTSSFDVTTVSGDFSIKVG